MPESLSYTLENHYLLGIFQFDNSQNNNNFSNDKPYSYFYTENEIQNVTTFYATFDRHNQADLYSDIDFSKETCTEVKAPNLNGFNFYFEGNLYSDFNLIKLHPAINYISNAVGPLKIVKN